MKKQFMIGLETLDTKPTAAFISIGAVEFDLTTGDLDEARHQAKYVAAMWRELRNGR